MRIVFMGGRSVGIIGFLTLLARGNSISCAVSYSTDLARVVESFKTPNFKSVRALEFIKAAASADLLVSVHGREIVRREMLEAPRLGAINVHPYLYKYKGANPVGRALAEGEFKASVGVHRMTEEVDVGEVLAEEFLDVSGSKTVDEIYARLYPEYSVALSKALLKVEAK